MVSLDVIPFPIVVVRLESPGSFEKEPGHIVEGQLIFDDCVVGHADNLNHALVVIPVESVLLGVAHLLKRFFLFFFLGVLFLHKVISTEVLTNLLSLVLVHCDIVRNAEFRNIDRGVLKDTTGIISECSAFTRYDISMVVRSIFELSINVAISCLSSKSHEVTLSHKADI